MQLDTQFPEKNEMIFQKIIHDKQRISKQIHDILCITLFFQKKNINILNNLCTLCKKMYAVQKL